MLHQHYQQLMFIFSLSLFYLIRPNKKRSLLRLTRPTVFWSADWTLFFDFASDSFWRRSVRGQLHHRPQSREKSRRVKIKQREGDLDCWLRLRVAIQAHVETCDRRTTISVGCSKSCINFASCDLLLQLWNWHVRLHFLGVDFVLAQLISCFSSTAMPLAVSVNFSADKKPFAEDVFCILTSFRTTRFAF